ncbi:conserved hypothetical protein [delta proteobacterium NaphS2]|nr:conserved hypothetical protein [delta proteobacterium NaphS2]
MDYEVIDSGQFSELFDVHFDVTEDFSEEPLPNILACVNR